jgi:hypothetical protein
MDKRFWSRAVIAVTVAVAGVGALPTILLRPAAEPVVREPAVKSDETPAAVAPAVIPPSPPVAIAAAPASPPSEEPRPAEPVTAAPPVPVVATPPAATPSAVAAAPAEPARETTPDVFPPVQPVEAVTPSEAAPEAVSAVIPSRKILARRAVRKWVRLARARAARTARHNGETRPAAYPIHEFLAFHR